MLTFVENTLGIIVRVSELIVHNPFSLVMKQLIGLLLILYCLVISSVQAQQLQPPRCCNGLNASPTAGYRYFNLHSDLTGIIINNPPTIYEIYQNYTNQIDWSSIPAINEQGQLILLPITNNVQGTEGQDNGFASLCNTCTIDLGAYKFLDSDGDGRLDVGDYATRDELLKAFFQKTLFRTLSGDANPYLSVIVKKVEVNCDDCSWGFLSKGSDDDLLYRKALNAGCGNEQDNPCNNASCETIYCPGAPRDLDCAYPGTCCASFQNKLITDKSQENYHIVLHTGTIKELVQKSEPSSNETTIALGKDMGDRFGAITSPHLNLVRGARGSSVAGDACMVDVVFEVQFKGDPYNLPPYHHYLQLPYLFGTEENLSANTDALPSPIDDRFGIFCQYLGNDIDVSNITVASLPFAVEDLYSARPKLPETVFNFSLPYNTLHTDYLSVYPDQHVLEQCLNYNYLSKYLSLCKNVPMVNDRRDAQGIHLEQAGTYHLKFAIGETDNVEPPRKDVWDSGLIFGEAYVCSSPKNTGTLCNGDDRIQLLDEQPYCGEPLTFLLQDPCTLSAEVYIEQTGTARIQLPIPQPETIQVNGVSYRSYPFDLPSLNIDLRLFTITLKYVCNGETLCFQRELKNYNNTTCRSALAQVPHLSCNEPNPRVTVNISYPNVQTPCPRDPEIPCTVTWYYKTSPTGEPIFLSHSTADHIDLNMPLLAQIQEVSRLEECPGWCNYAQLVIDRAFSQAPDVNIAVSPVSSCGEKSNLRVLTQGGVCRGTVLYQWSTGATTEVLNDVVPGSYTVSVICDQCTTAVTAVVEPNIFTLPTLPANIDIACGNECGSFDLAGALGWDSDPFSGGKRPYRLKWSHDPNKVYDSNAAGVFYFPDYNSPPVPDPAHLKPGYYFFELWDSNNPPCYYRSPPIRVQLENGIGFIDCVTCDSCPD